MKNYAKILKLALCFSVLLIVSVHGLSSCSGNNDTKTYDVDGIFASVSIKTDVSDVILLHSDGGCRVECTDDGFDHSIKTSGGELSIEIEDDRPWYKKLFGFGKSTVKVYLPSSEYLSLEIEGATGDVRIPDGFTFGSIDIELSTGDVECSASALDTLSISLSTGDVSVEDIMAGSLDIRASTGDIEVSRAILSGDINVEVSTGEVELSDITCKSLTTSGGTGEVSLSRVVALEKIHIERGTGEVELERSDAPDIYINTSTGDVEGSLLSGKSFTTKTATGKVRVPDSVEGGRCEIITSTGDIKITIVGK